MSIPNSLGDLEAMEREMFDEYNGEGPRYKSDDEFYSDLLDNELVSSLMTPQRLIDYINMDDCHGESYEIFDCMSEFGKVKPLRYKGWQPGCLIEVVDEGEKIW